MLWTNIRKEEMGIISERLIDALSDNIINFFIKTYLELTKNDILN